MIHFPSRSGVTKRGHRLVVLPDYQGLGIGHKFSSLVASYYKKKGFKFFITSGSIALAKQRAKDPRWKVINLGRNEPHKGTKHMVKSGSHNRYTISFEYIG